MELKSSIDILLNEGLNITTKWQPREANDFSSILSLLMNKWDEREKKKKGHSVFI